MRFAIFLIIGFVFQTIGTFSQTYNSSCVAPDSIINKYQEDADRLTLRMFKEDSLSYADSVRIPKAYSDTFLNALMAVYNLNLPERDTVVEINSVHTNIVSPDYPFELNVYADSSLLWMQELEQGNLTTGHSAIDALISEYNLTVKEYEKDVPFQENADLVVFQSDSNLNMKALASLFDTISDVSGANVSYLCCDGWDISGKVYSNYVELTYSIRWGDCFSGCMYSRNFVFKVYNDCSVEFTGAFGELLPYVSVFEVDNHNVEVTVYPNPSSNFVYFSLESPKQSIESISIFALNGKEVIQTHKTRIDVQSLANGMYFYSVSLGNNQFVRGRFLKE